MTIVPPVRITRDLRVMIASVLDGAGAPDHLRAVTGLIAAARGGPMNAALSAPARMVRLTGQGMRAAGFRLWLAPWLKTTNTGRARFAGSLADLADLQAPSPD